MPRKKLNETQEQEVLQLRSQGKTQKEIVNYLRERYKLDITEMGVSEVEARAKRYFTGDLMTDSGKERKLKMDMDLQEAMEIGIKLCLELLQELKEKKDKKE